MRLLRARSLGLRSRLMGLVLAAVLLLLLASAAAVHLGTRGFIDEIAGSELAAAERVWQRFYELRGRRLLSETRVLAEDFGFREAVASGDADTGLSALLNHAARVDADFAVLLDSAGRPLLSAPQLPEELLAPALRSLLEEGLEAPGAVGLLEIDEVALQLALVPVHAPRRIAWAGFGFAIGPQVLQDFRSLTGADVTLFAADGERVLASSLVDTDRSALVARFGAASVALPAMAADDNAVARASAIERRGQASLPLLLQFDSERFAAPMGRLQRQILQLSALVALPALVLAGWAARGVTQPLRNLTLAVSRIAAGDYAQSVPRGGGDELTRLALAVDAMQGEIRSREARIEEQGRQDGLTGLANRHHALGRLSALPTPPEGNCWRLVLLDIRRFSEVNDALGPAVGDRILVEVAKRLRSLRPEALLARFGANEFLLLDSASLADPAEPGLFGLLAALQEAYALDAAPVRVDFCAGWAEFPRDARLGVDLLRRAQLALADAKREGLPACAYRPGSEARHLRQLRLMADLRQASERAELHLLFQPKVDLRSGRPVHAEALLRWRHPELGPIGPDEFVPLAERAGLVGLLTRHVLAESLLASAGWRRQGLDLAVAVNLSALDLADLALAPRVRGLLETLQFPANRLIVEVTESAVVRDVELAIRQLQALRALGVRVAIDDFGTGQSSLAQLQRLPVDELKIDKSFVLGLEPGAAEAEIVRTTVELGHRLGLQVIAEGIETPVGLRLLQDIGCDLGQGYLFSRPIEAAAMVGWCATFTAALPPAARTMREPSGDQ